MSKPFEQVSKDAQTRLQEFSEEHDEALVAAPPKSLWAGQFGKQKLSKAIKTTYPLPVSQAGYIEDKGDHEMRTLYAKSVSITPIRYADGVMEMSDIIEAPDFTGWEDEPKRIAIEELRHPNKLVAAVLEANANLEFDGLPLFDNAHPLNVFDSSVGTFDNDHTAGTIAAAVTAAELSFSQRLAPNGENMGLMITDLLVPGALWQAARTYLEDDRLLQVVSGEGVASMKNFHFGIINLIRCNEFTSTTDIYFIDRNGPWPWITQSGGPPDEIRYDKDSDRWKDTGYVGLKFRMLAGAVAALPHAIEKYVIS